MPPTPSVSKNKFASYFCKDQLGPNVLPTIMQYRMDASIEMHPATIRHPPTPRGEYDDHGNKFIV